MTSLRRLRALALVTMLTLTSALAAPIGGNPGPVEIVESPPTFGNCNLPISVMSGLTVDSKGAVFTLSNPSTTKSQDFLIFDLIVSGKQRLYWVPVVLRPGVAIGVHASFLTTVDSPVILLCQTRPGGIVDDPQPVVGVVAVPPDSLPESP